MLNDPRAARWSGRASSTRCARGCRGLRRALADALRARTGSDRFGWLAGHRGMFTRLPATAAQAEAMRRDHGVYVVGDGRMNVAGLADETIPAVADAVVAVGL